MTLHISFQIEFTFAYDFVVDELVFIFLVVERQNMFVHAST